MPRWGSAVLFGRPPVTTEMARARQYRGSTVTYPTDLTPRMRRAWTAVDPWVTDEQMDAVWEALKPFRVTARTKGDGPDTN